MCKISYQLSSNNMATLSLFINFIVMSAVYMHHYIVHTNAPVMYVCSDELLISFDLFVFFPLLLLKLEENSHLFFLKCIDIQVWLEMQCFLFYLWIITQKVCLIHIRNLNLFLQFVISARHPPTLKKILQGNRKLNTKLAVAETVHWHSYHFKDNLHMFK